MQRTAIGIGIHLNGTRVAGSDVAGTCSGVPYLNKRSFFVTIVEHTCHVHVIDMSCVYTTCSTV